MIAIVVATIEIAAVPTAAVPSAAVPSATVSKVQEVEGMPPVGSTWICARIPARDGNVFPVLKGRVTRVAHPRGQETPGVIEFSCSMSAAEFSPGFVAALKAAGWQIDPPIHT